LTRARCRPLVININKPEGTEKALGHPSDNQHQRAIRGEMWNGHASFFAWLRAKHVDCDIYTVLLIG
jgi:hypothetical protein